jgi:hypothetical protein
MTYLHARTINDVLKVQERRIELKRKKGELVDRAKAMATVFQLARQERANWAGWPARIAAIIAAELSGGAHMVQMVLETHVRRHLEELADIRADFHWQN